MQAMQRAMESKQVGKALVLMPGQWKGENKEHSQQQEYHKIKKKNRQKSEVKEAKRFACRSRYKQQPNKIYPVNVRKLYRH